MTQKNILLIAVSIAILITGYFFFPGLSVSRDQVRDLDPTPKNVTLSGTYACLPHINNTGPQTMECAFGIKTDSGDYYAVDFGPDLNSPDQFQSGKHITAEGWVVIREALSSDHWFKYNMKGIFTITKIISPAVEVNGKLNINVICEGALAYMTFPDGESAKVFVEDCKQGKHPEVIEQYKAQMGIENDAAI